MKSSVLSGLAAALSGGLKGYNSAKDRQRQDALDALQKQRMEQDDILKRAALDAKMAAEQQNLALKGQVLEEKARSAGLTEQDRVRKGFQAGWDPKASDMPQERGQYFGLAEDFVSARPGPDLPKDEFGVYDVKGPDGEDVGDEWNNLPAEYQTQGYVRAKGDDILAEVARKQAALRGQKQSDAMERVKAATAGKIEVKNAEGARKDMEGSMVEQNLKEVRAIKGMENNVGMVAKAVPPGLWSKKMNEVSKWFESQDPATAMTFSGLNRSYLEERNALTGAAASAQEDAFIRSSMPNPDDDFKTFMAKAWIYQKMREYQYAVRMNELAKVRNTRGADVPPIPPPPWTQYQSIGAAINEIRSKYGGAGATPAGMPPGAGPSARPVGGVKGF